MELLFKELKSRFGLNEINTTDPYLIEALILIAAIPLITSCVIVEELQMFFPEFSAGLVYLSSDTTNAIPVAIEWAHAREFQLRVVYPCRQFTTTRSHSALNSTSARAPHLRPSPRAVEHMSRTLLRAQT